MMRCAVPGGSDGVYEKGVARGVVVGWGSGGPSPAMPLDLERTWVMETIGTCSLCLGPVKRSLIVKADVPRCAECGAVAKAAYGPIIEMAAPGPYAEEAADERASQAGV
jgi:hypothetical protein